VEILTVSNVLFTPRERTRGLDKPTRNETGHIASAGRHGRGRGLNMRAELAGISIAAWASHRLEARAPSKGLVLLAASTADSLSLLSDIERDQLKLAGVKEADRCARVNAIAAAAVVEVSLCHSWGG
jgi:hypothetical protein